MVILHYAGISDNHASGVSVVVPQIINSMRFTEQVALYNYGTECSAIQAPAVLLSSRAYSDDYHTFPQPFSHPDIVIFHSPFGLPRMTGICKRLKKDRIPYVIVPHGCFSEAAMKKKWLKKRLAMALFFRQAFANADAIQYLCENERGMSVVKHRSIIVPNGIEIPPAIDRRCESVRSIVFIGRKDIYHKGIDILIQGCAKIKSLLVSSGVTVRLYGPGDEAQNRTVSGMISENGLDEVVINMPGIFGGDKAEVLSSADLFVLTSRSEGQPIAVLEALSYSLPVLVTPGTGFFEEVKENHCGIPVELSTDQIAEGIAKAVKNPEAMRSASKNAYSYACRAYSWDYVAALASEKYQEVCDEKNRRV